MVMTTKLDILNKSHSKKDIPDIKPGDVVRIHLKLPEKTKRGAERIQVFEGLVIARKHGKGINATFTVRKVIDGVGVERIFPLHMPGILKIEVVKHSKVKRAKLYYMRKRSGKKARMITKEELLEAEGETEAIVPSEAEPEKSKEEITAASAA